MWPLNPSGNVAPMFYPLFCTLFSVKNGNFAHNHRFLCYFVFTVCTCLRYCGTVY